MTILPSLNHVTVLGILRNIKYKEEWKLPYQFELDVMNSKEKIVTLKCGALDIHNHLEKVKEGMDYILLNGKLRSGGFVQARTICIINDISSYSSPIHDIALLGRIKSLTSKYISTDAPFNKWSIDVDIFTEYGKPDIEEIEATTTCIINHNPKNDPNSQIEKAQPGDWLAISGKLKENGIIQTRTSLSYSFFKTSDE